MFNDLIGCEDVTLTLWERGVLPPAGQGSPHAQRQSAEWSPSCPQSWTVCWSRTYLKTDQTLSPSSYSSIKLICYFIFPHTVEADVMIGQNDRTVAFRASSHGHMEHTVGRLNVMLLEQRTTVKKKIHKYRQSNLSSKPPQDDLLCC